MHAVKFVPIKRQIQPDPKTAGKGIIAADGDAIQGKLDTIETTNNACQVLLGTIDADTGAVKTATEAIENAVHVDDAAYTLGTHSVMMMGGFAGTQAVGANDAGALAMTTTGFLKIVNPMTTTQLDDGKSVSAGGSTTSSILNTI